MRKKRTGRKIPTSKRRQKLILGFDLGGTKLASGVVTLDGKVLASRKDMLDLSHGRDAFVRFLGDIAKQWQAEYPKIAALGIASLGPLDIDKGILLAPPNFPRWGNFPVAAPLHKRLGIPVFMHNDAAAAAAAEGWLGGAKKMQNWMTLTFGTGLGTGVIMHREVFMGGSGLGPEAGHIIITDKKYACGCGNSGCAEAALSGTALRKRIQECREEWTGRNVAPPTSPEGLVELARMRDSTAIAIFDDFIQMLARAIHNYSVLFKPEKIFLGGGLGAASDLFLDRTLVLVAEMLKGRPGYEPQIEVSSLEGKCGVLAGAWVAVSRGIKKSNFI